MQVYAAYWAALEDRDLGRVLGVVGDLRADGWSSTEVIEGLVVPTQTRVGELWLSGILPISGEHAMTSINEAVVASLSGDDPEGGSGPPVVVACLDPDEHVLAAAVVAVELHDLGAPVHLLPGSATAGELVRTVERLAAHAVLLSVTMASSLVKCRAVLRDLHEASIPVVVGGRAWGAEPRRALTWGASHAPTVPAAWRLLAGPSKLLTAESASDRRTLASGREAGWAHETDETDETDEAGEVAEQRFAIASEMSPRLLRGLAAREERIPVRWPDLATQLDHLVGALAASLATKDPAVLWEFDEWLTALVGARSDVEAVSPLTRPLTRLVWAALAETLAEGHPEAQAALRRAGLVTTAAT